jgi:hypothetical protein
MNRRGEKIFISANVVTNEAELYEIGPTLQTLFQVMYYTLSVTNLMSNSLIAFVIIRNKKMHKATNFFILNLALADILMNICATPFQFELVMTKNSIFSEFVCKIGPLVRSLNATVSILTLVCLSIDRAYVIIFPLKKKLTKIRSLFIIGFIWIVGILIGLYSFYIHELFIFEIHRDQKMFNFVCSIVDDFPVSLFLALTIICQYVLPLFVFVFTFTFIKRNNRRQDNQMIGSNNFGFMASFHRRQKVSI